MAIEKKKIYHIQCEGPCGQNMREVTVLPANWSYLKIVPVRQVIGHPLEYQVSALCLSCSCKAIHILKNNGFKIMTVSANEQKKEEEQ